MGPLPTVLCWLNRGQYSMAFTVSATNAGGSTVSFSTDTARDELEKWLEFERAGYQSVAVKDDKGGALSRAELEALYTPKKQV